MQEHVDAAQVVRRQVDLLTKVLTAARRPEKLRELQEQGPRARAGIVHARDVGAPIQGEGREDLGDLLGRVELATRLTRARGIHGHQVLVCVAEGIDLRSTMLQRQIADSIHDLHELRVTLGDRVPKLRGVHVHIVKEATQIRLGAAAPRRVLNEAEGVGEGLIQVLVTGSPNAHVSKQVRRANKKALFLDDAFTRCFRLLVAEGRVIEGRGLIRGSTFSEDRRALRSVHVVRQVLRDEAVEQKAQDVALEVPPVHTAAQVVGDAPDCLMQLGSLDHCRHGVLISGVERMSCTPTWSISSLQAHYQPDVRTAQISLRHDPTSAAPRTPRGCYLRFLSPASSMTTSAQNGLRKPNFSGYSPTATLLDTFRKVTTDPIPTQRPKQQLTSAQHLANA